MTGVHGVELVDEITGRIDAALSGYETQRAGDRWYGGSLPEERTEADWAALVSAIAAVGVTADEVLAGIAEVLRPLVDLFPALGLPPPSNDWAVRACKWWDYDVADDDIWQHEDRPFR